MSCIGFWCRLLLEEAEPKCSLMKPVKLPGICSNHFTCFQLDKLKSDLGFSIQFHPFYDKYGSLCAMMGLVMCLVVIYKGCYRGQLDFLKPGWSQCTYLYILTFSSFSFLVTLWGWFFCINCVCWFFLVLVCRYVFDGKPPDLKKQELAKRYFEWIFCYFWRVLIFVLRWG